MVEVMHFYHMTWDEINKLPLKLFWTFLKSMYRIEARQNLRMVQVISMPNISEEGRREYIDQQLKTLGTITVSEERDEDGMQRLKDLM